MTALQKRSSFAGDPLYNPFERPSMPLSALGLDGFGLGSGSGTHGQNVTVESGMAIPTAYRCLAIISTVVASLVLEEVNLATGDAERWDVLDGLESYTAFELMELTAARIAGWGNFFGRETRVNGVLRDMSVYPGGDVKVIKKRGQKYYRVKLRNDDGTAQYAPDKPNQVMYEDFAAADPDCPIFHIPGFGFDGLQGISPILLAAQTFGTTLAADRLAGKFYSHGQQLGGLLKVKAPLESEDQAEGLRARWQNRHAGIQNAGGIAILDAETDFQAITIEPEALQFLQSRQWQATEVARMFGVPPHLVSELEKSTSWGAGIEQQNIGFVAYTIRSYTDRIEQRYTRRYPKRGYLKEFDLDRLLRGSMMERFQAYGQAIGWGWMTRAEVRKKERQKALDKKFRLDEPLTPQAMNGALQDGPLAAAGSGKPSSGGPNAPKTPDKNGPQENDE